MKQVKHGLRRATVAQKRDVVAITGANVAGATVGQPYVKRHHAQPGHVHQHGLPFHDERLPVQTVIGTQLMFVVKQVPAVGTAANRRTNARLHAIHARD